MQREIVRAQQKDREAFLSRLRADRLDEIGAGRPLDPRSHETAQHDDREPVGCDKSGTAIGGAKVCVLLQLNNVIQVERAADTIDETAAGSDGTLMVMPSTVRLGCNDTGGSDMSIP